MAGMQAPQIIGTPVVSGTSGSILYVDSSGNLAQDNANNFWDATNHRLGLGTITPSAKLHIQSAVADATTYDSFVTWPSTAARNDANFCIGYFFSVPESITVSQLGRLYVAGNSQNHKVIIWSMADSSIVVQGTVLAATASDGNGFKYVAVTPTLLTPDKTYIITVDENAAGDTWKDLYSSTGFFSPYIKRLGFAYKLAVSTYPDTITPGSSIYNTPAMKFTIEGVPQQRIGYDATNFINILSRSDGSATIFPSNLEKGIALGAGASVGKGGFLGTTLIGATTYPTTFEVAGLMVITGGYPALIITDGTTPFSFGTSSGNGASLRWSAGNAVLNSNGILYLNYDNGTEVNLNGFYSHAGKSNVVQMSVNAFSTQTANLVEWRDNGNIAMSVVSGTGKIGALNIAPTAYVHLGAGTATANTSPLKFTSGTLLTSPEAGAVEFLTDSYYGTTTTGAKRKMFVAGITGRSTAQNAAVATVATYTLGATDASFEVSANVNVTVATAHSFTATCTYTDETNTSRTITFGFIQLTGSTFITAITNITGTGPYESPIFHIRCKASTAITIATTGTFTTVTYNVEGIIKQIA